MQVMEYLDKSGVKYELSEHKPTFTAQHMAAEEHESGEFVAKPVIVKVDGDYMMCVLGACFKIDLGALKVQLGAEKVELAQEEEIAGICGGCDIGAEPPFGNLYNLPTIMDKALEMHDHIVFQGGTHESAIRISMADYTKLAKPRMMEFGYHTTY